MTDLRPAPALPAFAPSELVLLFGDRFAPEGGVLATRDEVLTSGVKVHAQKLMDAAVGAAVWAVHGSGAARLEVRETRAVFGLMKKRHVHLVPGTGSPPFPAGSLEAYLAGSAAAAPRLQDVLQAYIAAEVTDPPARVLALMKAGLAERGLLAREERTTLKVFTTVSYTLPPETRAAAEREALEPVQALLRDAEQREPELHGAVRKAVDGARAMMTESSSSN